MDKKIKNLGKFYKIHIFILTVIIFCIPSRLLAQENSDKTTAAGFSTTKTSASQKSGAKQNIQMDAFSKEAVKGFADELYLQGFFDEAASEYRRFLFISNDFTPQNTENIEAISSLCSIYRLQNNKTGSQWLFNNFFKITSLPLQEQLVKLYSQLTFKERNSQDFSTLFTTAKPFIKDFSQELQFLLPFSTKILSQDINGAQKICREFSDNIEKSSLTKEIMNENLTKLINQCNSYKTKSPGLALFLSSIFPGAGRWYTGSLRGGFSSFIYVGSFTAGTVYSAIKFGWQDWRPYTFGTVAVCFYAAELYGAYKSAQRYNQYLYNAICEQTDAVYEEIY